MIAVRFYFLIVFIFLSSLDLNAWTAPTIAKSKKLNVLAGSYGGSGNVDGPGMVARFNSVAMIKVDSSGNLIIADRFNHTIRKMDKSGNTTTIAGASGVSGTADGTGTAARFNNPVGLAIDSGGNIFIADFNNYTIRKMTPAGVVTTFAGTAGSAATTDGTGAAARFSGPYGLAIDSSDNLFVTDINSSVIRKITPAGVVTTLAGTANIDSYADGTGAAAKFYSPAGIAIDSGGNLYVTDRINQLVRKITSAGVVTTLAGTALASGSADGNGSAARFLAPHGIVVNGAGNILVADTNNHTLRSITPAGDVTTIAGIAGTKGDGDGPMATTALSGPGDIAIDSVTGVMYVTHGGYVIRKIAAGVVTTLAGRNFISGSSDGVGQIGKFFNPVGIAISKTGTVYVADTMNSLIRVISPRGVVSTLAGSAGLQGNTNGTGSAARFNLPSAIALDSVGNIFVADRGGHSIRKVTPTGIVTLFAGIAGSAGSTDGAFGVAKLNTPTGLAIDSHDNLFTVDRHSHTIRKITPAGDVTTLAGTAASTGSADGTGAAARFNFPVGGIPVQGTGLTIDKNDNLYVADTNNFTIRKITPAGVVTTIAGTVGATGIADGVGAAARFTLPVSVAADPMGNVFVLDRTTRTVRKVTPAGVVTTVVGVNGIYGVKPGALPASIGVPFGIGYGAGKLFILSENSIQWVQKP